MASPDNARESASLHDPIASAIAREYFSLLSDLAEGSDATEDLDADPPQGCQELAAPATQERLQP